MGKLNMKGSFILDPKIVAEKLTEISAGNYALGRKNKEGQFLVDYIGRSDADVKACLLELAEKSHSSVFKYSYAATAQEAFEKECQNYHDFEPPQNDSHPEKSEGCDWKCPVCD